MIYAPKLIGLRVRNTNDKREGVVHAVAFHEEPNHDPGKAPCAFVVLVEVDEGETVGELAEWYAKDCVRVDDEERLAQLAERGIRERDE